MGPWVGPAIIAAAISSLFIAVGWFVTYRLGVAAEERRRREKIRDFQIALRAEIRSELKNLSVYNFDELLADVETQYQKDKSYSVAVPRVARHAVFEALVSEIHILPEEVIDPVILYARQRQAVESLAEDMRDASFKAISKDRQLAMYRDYLSMWKTWRDLAAEAESALSGQSRSIAGPRTRLPSDGLNDR